jgi:hypothetical protein
MVLGAVIIVLMVLGAVISVLAVRHAISPEWIGFAGNVAAGAMTLFAAWVAWRGVQDQIAIQGALQRVLILQQQLQTLESDHRLTAIVERQGKEAALVSQNFFAGPSVKPWQVDSARKELEAKQQELDSAVGNFTLFSTPRSALKESIETRKGVITKLDDLKSKVAAARHALAAIPKGEAEISPHHTKTCLAINVKNEVDALHAACSAHRVVIRNDINRLEGLLEDTRKEAGL